MPAICQEAMSSCLGEILFQGNHYKTAGQQLAHGQDKESVVRSSLFQEKYSKETLFPGALLEITFSFDSFGYSTDRFLLVILMKSQSSWAKHLFPISEPTD